MMNSKKTIFLFVLGVFCLRSPAGQQTGANGLTTDFTGPEESPLIIRGDYVLRGPTLIQYRGREENVIIPGDWGITEIADRIFGSARIKTVVIPEGVVKVGDYAFQDCPSLSSVSLPASLAHIGNEAFSGCESLASITVNRNNAHYAVQDGVLFTKDFSVLIQYPPGKTDSTYSVPAGVAAIANRAFHSCGNLLVITLPNSVTQIGAYAFYGCHELQSISLGNALVRIGENAFAWCMSLASIRIPDSVTVIENRTFAWCSNLVSVNLGTGITTIGNEAFSDCRFLRSVIIPDGVTRIGDQVFSFCEQLTSVTLQSLNPPEVGNLGSSWNANIFVRPAALEAYRNAPGWKNHADRIRPKAYDW
jgi:hypothetical protein